MWLADFLSKPSRPPWLLKRQVEAVITKRLIPSNNKVPRVHASSWSAERTKKFKSRINLAYTTRWGCFMVGEVKLIVCFQTKVRTSELGHAGEVRMDIILAFYTAGLVVLESEHGGSGTRHGYNVPNPCDPTSIRSESG